MPLTVLDHRSEVLVGNACGDPHARKLWVYTPPDYHRSGERYPVVWCLAAYAGSGAGECVGTPWSPGLPERLDRLIAAGMPPVIAAFPDCFTRWGGSQYMNSPATGRYEDYLCDELVPYVDAEFRTNGRRAAFGRSSGGYGALRLALRRPGLFAAIASISGDAGFELAYPSEFADAIARIHACGSLEAWVEQFEAREKMAGGDFAVVQTVAMSACYSPDPDAPFGFAFPFELETGALRPAIWQRWLANDPIRMVDTPEATAALRALELLHLECGDRDEVRLHLGLRRLTRRLAALGIACEAEEFPDAHRSLRYRYERVLPKLATALRRKPRR
jgi:enterochelin esterase family protein